MNAPDIATELARLQPTLKDFTHRFTRDRDESLDLVQDTLLKALTYKDKFREDTNLKGWLFTIMRNTFINNYRKDQRIRFTRDGDNVSPPLNIRDTHTFNLPDARFEYKDLLQRIQTLREEFQTPFKMHASGYKYNEIAMHLGIPIGTVKNRIFQARKEIQEKMTAY